MNYITVIAILTTQVALIISINKLSERVTRNSAKIAEMIFSNSCTRKSVLDNQMQIATLLRARAEISMLKEEVRCLKETIDALIQEVG